MTSFMKVTYVKNGKTISSVIIFTVGQKSARVGTTADHPATTGMGENVTIEKVSSNSFFWREILSFAGKFNSILVFFL